jgi:hypothetical protein
MLASNFAQTNATWGALTFKCASSRIAEEHGKSLAALVGLNYG